MTVAAAHAGKNISDVSFVRIARPSVTPRSSARASAAVGGRVDVAPATLVALRAALAEVPTRLATAPYTAFAGYSGPAVAGKTGTAETGIGGVTHAWFVAYTPAPEASLTLAVLIERGGEGALVAAPLARRIIEQGLRPGVAPGRLSAEGRAPPAR